MFCETLGSVQLIRRSNDSQSFWKYIWYCFLKFATISRLFPRSHLYRPRRREYCPSGFRSGSCLHWSSSLHCCWILQNFIMFFHRICKYIDHCGRDGLPRTLDRGASQTKRLLVLFDTLLPRPISLSFWDFVCCICWFRIYCIVLLFIVLFWYRRSHRDAEILASLDISYTRFSWTRAGISLPSSVFLFLPFSYIYIYIHIYIYINRFVWKVVDKVASGGLRCPDLFSFCASLSNSAFLSVSSPESIWY